MLPMVIMHTFPMRKFKIAFILVETGTQQQKISDGPKFLMGWLGTSWSPR